MKNIISSAKHLPKRILNNKYVRKIVLFLQDLADFLWNCTNKFSKIAFKYLRRLPWKIISIITAVILIIAASVFHFYIADTGRITSQYQSNLDSYTALLNDFEDADLYMPDVATLRREMQTSLTSLDSLEETANNTSVSLPQRFVSEYALSDVEELNKQLDVIYGTDSRVNISLISSYSNAHAELIRATNELFTKNIEDDTNGYIAYLEETIKKIEDIEKNNEDLDLETILRIYTQILNSAEQYKADQNIDRFNSQFSNVSSELYKEIIKSWKSSMTPLRAWTGAQKSSFESITKSIIPNN